MNGGETGIRTQEGLAPLSVFKTDAFNRSAISPKLNQLVKYIYYNVFNSNINLQILILETVNTLNAKYSTEHKYNY